MSNYRRAYTPGGHYFFTLVTHGRQKLFDRQNNIDRLRDAFRHVKKKRPFSIDAIVILPDHLHLVLGLPKGETDFSQRLRLIKHHLSIHIDAPRNHRGEKRIWQRRFWEHLLRDEQDWRNHIDYIHYNPVKHGYVQRPLDWPHSSFSRAVRKGWYDENWGSAPPPTIEGMELE